MHIGHLWSLALSLGEHGLEKKEEAGAHPPGWPAFTAAVVTGAPRVGPLGRFGVWKEIPALWSLDAISATLVPAMELSFIFYF